MFFEANLAKAWNVKRCETLSAGWKALSLELSCLLKYFSAPQATSDSQSKMSGCTVSSIGAAMGGEVDEVVRGEAVGHRHEDRAELRRRVERLEMNVSIWVDGCDAITGLNLQPHQMPQTSGLCARRPALR